MTYSTLQSGEELDQTHLNPHITQQKFYISVSNCYLLLGLFASSSLTKRLWILSRHNDSLPQLLSSSRKCLKGFSIHRGSQEQLRVTGSHWPWPEQCSKHTAQICPSKWQYKNERRVIQEETCCSVPLTDCVHSEDFEEQIIRFLLQKLIPQETGQFWARYRPIWTLHWEPKNGAVLKYTQTGAFIVLSERCLCLCAV